MLIFKIIFLIGWIAAEGIRFPHRQRNKRELQQNRLAGNRVDSAGMALDLLAFCGMQLLPLVVVFSGWWDFAAYSLPEWAGWLGAATFGGVLYLLWRAHADLGRNWSPSLMVSEKPTLVTGGIYRLVRHPIYAAMWLWGIAQALLVWNWIGGLAGLVLFIPVYFYRVPREERMLIDQFGDQYRAYMALTGGVLPKF